MKTMAQKAGLGPNFKNHSGRKTMIQTLVNNDVPPTDIMQLSGQNGKRGTGERGSGNECTAVTRLKIQNGGGNDVYKH